jgi:hypothetical protein
VVDRVICDPTPTSCNRYIVVVPDGAATAVRQAVVRTVIQRLRWHLSSASAVPLTEGQPFDGPNADTGGFINNAEAELRNDVGSLDHGASAATGRVILVALRQNPHALAVRIIDTSSSVRA